VIPEPLVIPDGPVKRIDPRLKVLFAVLFSFAVALSARWPALWAGLGFSGMILAATKPGLWQVARRLLPAYLFILFLWVVLPLTVAGRPLFALGPISFTAAGFQLAGMVTLKATAILVVLAVFVGPLPIGVIGQVLYRFHFPEKLVYILLFCYRYIFVLEQEYHRLERMVRLRSFQPRTDLHTYRTYAYLVGMLFLRASLRADQVHRAMICRGFRGRFPALEEMRFRRADWFWAVALFIPPGVVSTWPWLTNLVCF